MSSEWQPGPVTPWDGQPRYWRHRRGAVIRQTATSDGAVLYRLINRCGNAISWHPTLEAAMANPPGAGQRDRDARAA